MKPEAKEKLLGLIRKIFSPQRKEKVSLAVIQAKEAMMENAILVVYFIRWYRQQLYPLEKMYHFEGGYMSAEDMKREIMLETEKGERILRYFEKRHGIKNGFPRTST